MRTKYSLPLRRPMRGILHGIVAVKSKGYEMIAITLHWSVIVGSGPSPAQKLS